MRAPPGLRALAPWLAAIGVAAAVGVGLILALGAQGLVTYVPSTQAPTQDNAYDLGLAGNRFRTLYLAGPARVVQTTPPTCRTNCGTGPAIVGSDAEMIVTMGTGPISPFTVTFATAYAGAPACGAVRRTGTAANVVQVVTSTPTMVVVTVATAIATGDTFAIHCGAVS